jgi:tRNA(Ile)-lysidine synthase
VELLADGAERYLALKSSAAPRGNSAEVAAAKVFDAEAFAVLPEEIRLRLLMRAINRFGHEGPAELGKVETLLAALDEAARWQPARRRDKPHATRLKQTLAGALVSVEKGLIRIAPAPARRRRKN